MPSAPLRHCSDVLSRYPAVNYWQEARGERQFHPLIRSPPVATLNPRNAKAALWSTAAVFNLPFLSQGSCNLMTKILWHTKKTYFFANLIKRIGIIMIHSHQMTLVLAVVTFFLLDNLREKRPVPLTKRSGVNVSESCGARVGNHWSVPLFGPCLVTISQLQMLTCRLHHL